MKYLLIAVAFFITTTGVLAQATATTVEGKIYDTDKNLVNAHGKSEHY